MAVVIRLQGLNITAGSQDIRKFFTGLTIPDGGVHIIGGEREEAFIIFASDEDARRAMTRSGGFIQGSSVTLLLSSKTEMHNVLEMSTKHVEMDRKWQPQDNTQRQRFESEAHLMGSHPREQREKKPSDDSFLFLKGLPFSVTEADIIAFFDGLAVDDVILLKKPNGQNNGHGLVKFATAQDATEGLARDKGYIGTRYVEISPTTEKDWLWNAGKRHRAAKYSDELGEHGAHFESFRDSQYRDRSPHRHWSSSKEHCVLLENLSYDVEKSDLKRLFWSANVQDDQVLFLVGDDGRRTRSAFVLFKTHQDYQDALAKDGIMLLDRWVSVQHISREKMMSLLQAQNLTARPAVESWRIQDESDKRFLLVLNLPFDVRKVELMDFLLGFNVREHNVFLLPDSRGAGSGRALVLFQSEAEARRALCLDGRRFLGSEVMLKCISRSQMGEFGVDPQVAEGSLIREMRMDRGGGGACDDPDVRRPHDRPATSRGLGYEPYPRHERDNGTGRPGPRYEGPTCVKLLNLPLQIKMEEIYDFCHGYRLIPGSVSLQYHQDGQPQGSATVVFESRQEALTAIHEISGRAIGARRIQLQFV
ncbi:RNA-binding protein 12B-like [Synchiropus splendidus]|uniref:RNA-binding protein 12B-like n=1 Tax=Synchiropus splendidus TaxID=270530 RepID=UPI00237E070D|nr:RNA-binding protein 12B-like [Synchiropus splendidus]